MFIKKKDYEALVADMERLYKEYEIHCEFRREMYNAFRNAENQYKSLPTYIFKSAELYHIMSKDEEESEN